MGQRCGNRTCCPLGVALILIAVARQGHEPCGAEMWQQDLLGADSGGSTPPRATFLSLFCGCVLVAFFVSFLLVACSAKNHHSMQSEGCDFPLSFSLHAASLPVYCSESRPVSPCHDHLLAFAP